MIKIKVKDAIALGAVNVHMCVEPLLKIGGVKIGYYSNAYGWRFDLYAVAYDLGFIYFVIGYQRVKGPSVPYHITKPLIVSFNEYEGSYFERRQYAIKILLTLYCNSR